MNAIKKDAFIKAGSPRHLHMHAAAQRAREYTCKLNYLPHTAAQIAQIMSELTCGGVGEGFGMFPPFYTDYGMNIHIGKNVFLNEGCSFQDHGGIFIGDGSLIGHRCIIATINHDLNPDNRGDMTVAPVHIGKNVWIGARVTILPGVNIGDGAVVAAGAVVNRDVPPNTVVAGVPAREVKKIT